MEKLKKSKFRSFSNKYTLRQFKAETLTSFLNGAVFGLVAAFYYIPFDFKNEDIAKKYRNSKLLYSASSFTRYGVLFAIFRCAYSFTTSNEFGPEATALTLGAAIALFIAFFVNNFSKIRDYVEY